METRLNQLRKLLFNWRVLSPVFAVFLAGIFSSCGSGLYTGAVVRYQGFPALGLSQIDTLYLRGGISVTNWKPPVDIRVSIDGEAATSAEVTGSFPNLRWRVRLPNRLSNPLRWAYGTRHTAEVSVLQANGKTIASRTGQFEMETLSDANGDGFPDLVIGANTSDVGATDAGSAYYFQSSEGSFASTTPILVSDPTPESGALFGRKTTFVGDLNGDSYGDAAFSVNFSNAAGVLRGGVYVAYGSSTGLQTTSLARRNCSGCVNATRMGFGVMGADVNGDGYDDLVAGSALSAAYVFFGSASGVAASQSQVISYPAGDSAPFFGIRALPIPDTNSDGYADLFLGAPFSDAAGPIDSGAGFIFRGSASGLSASPSTTFFDSTPLASDDFASAASTLDVNADGWGDLLIGTDSGNGGSGFLSGYLGSSTGFSSAPSFRLTQPMGRTLSFFPAGSVALSDLTGDSIADFAVATWGLETDTSFSGEVNIYQAKTDGSTPSAVSALAYPGSDPGALFGTLCSSDLDGDGIQDLIVSAQKSDIKSVDGGAVFIYYGTSRGFSATPQLTIPYPGTQTDASFGSGCKSFR